jgi:hypothetical protein
MSLVKERPLDERSLADVEFTSGFASLTYGLIVIYLVASRLIDDLYTVPVGLSLHPTDIILALLLGIWLLWMFTDPQPFPLGAASVLGVAVVASFLIAPFINALDMSEFEVNGSDTGLVRAVLYAGLFTASYHLAASRRRAIQLLVMTVAVTMFQALLAIYEQLVGEPLTLFGTIWQGIGLEIDPKGGRGAVVALQQRLTGELRASATAPHPLVLAGLLAVGIGVCLAFYLHTDSRRVRGWLLVAFAVQLLAIGATNQRTGFVVLAAIGVVMLFTQMGKLPSTLPLIGAAVMGAVAVAVVSPSTPRLILNFVTGQQTDHNVAVRTGKYEIFPQLLERRPFFGAGYATGDPELVTFDNGYLTGFVELGIIGFGLFLGFLLVVMGRSLGAMHRAPRADQPIMLAAVLATITFFTTMATFDVMSFSQLFPAVLIVMAIGLARADALHRSERSEMTPSAS